MSEHSRVLVASASAIAVLMCSARLAGGFASPSAGDGIGVSLFSLFGQEHRTPLYPHPEELTARSSAVNRSNPESALVPAGFGNPTVTGGVAQNTNL